jgi:hypothetical protein
VVKIEHREPKIFLQVRFTDASGGEQRMTFTFEAGAETTNSVVAATARTHARWGGMELVIGSWIKTSGREVHFKDRWSLSTDGRTLTMADRDDDLAGQISVLEKSSRTDI